MKQRLHERPWLVCLALAVAILVAYEPVRWNEFVRYDDDTYLTDNAVVRQGLTAEGVVWAFTTARASNWHPLTWLSHMLDCELFGLDPWGHHLINVLLHAANALVLLALLKSMTGALWPSAFVAAVFALHPFRVESVAWAAERKDVLSGLCFMLTLAAYVRYTRRPGVRGYLLLVFAFALGLLAKPMLVSTPLVLLLLDYWPLGRFATPRIEAPRLPTADPSTANHASGTTLSRLVLEKAPLVVLSLLSCMVTIWVQQQAGSLRSFAGLPHALRVANALVACVAYLLQTLYPASLAPLYPHPGLGLPIWQPLVCLAVVVGIFKWVLRDRRRRPYLFVGWMWYVVMLLPVSGLVQVGMQARADRYTYLPLIGVFIAFAWGVGELLNRMPRLKRTFAVGACLLVLGLLVATRTQARHWHDSKTLFARALAVTEGNFLMEYNMATALKTEGKTDEAIRHLDQALRINPRFARGHALLGTILARQGDQQRAVQHLTEALRLEPDLVQAEQELNSLQATSRLRR